MKVADNISRETLECEWVKTGKHEEKWNLSVHGISISFHFAGQYSVILDESHYKDLLHQQILPLASTVSKIL